MSESNFDLKETIVDVVKKRDAKKIKEIFDLIPNIDIAESLAEVDDVKDLIWIFRVVPKDYTADFFAELTTDQQEDIINAFSDKELLELLENSFADDIVDVAEELPANLINRILRVAKPEMRKNINMLLNLKEDTAGSVMTTEFIEMRDNIKVKDAIEYIREKGKDAETIYTIFVKDKTRTLVGTVDLDDLIFAKDNETLADIMNKDFVTCDINDDQEEVANKFKRYDLNAMAVVNNENKIIGIITIDDVVDVMEQEASEDIAALSHVQPLEDSYLETSVFKMAKKCVPWIIILLILGTFTTMVLDRIEKAHIFTLIPVLIAFVPTLMDTGGNAGGQTIALMIRGLSTGEFGPKDFFKILAKEALTALIVAASVSVFAFIWFTIEQYFGIVSISIEGHPALEGANIWNGLCWTGEFATTALLVSFSVSISLFAASFISKIVAVCLPMGVAALKKDPAVIAQPLLTTIVDVASLLAYLGIASVILMRII